MYLLFTKAWLRKNAGWTPLKAPSRSRATLEPRRAKAAEPSDRWQQGEAQQLSHAQRRRFNYTSISQTTRITICLLPYSHLHIQNIGTCGLALNFIENNPSVPRCSSCYRPGINWITMAVLCCNAGFFFSNAASYKLQIINWLYGRMILNWHVIF